MTNTCVTHSIRSATQRSIRRTLACSAPRLATARLSSLSRPPTRPPHPRQDALHSLVVDTLRTTQRRGYSSSSNASPPASTLPDPDRPDLFYHLYNAPNAVSAHGPIFALSFLPEAPPSILSDAVIGWLPASGAGEEAGLNDFVENEKFRELLHSAIQAALRDGADEVQRNGAIQLGEGWMHIHGMSPSCPHIADCPSRNLPALGRIGDPDDIIASVRVENAQINADTYQPMPSYRMCTSDGVLQLTEGLAARLIEVLRERIQEDSSSSSAR
ncbi:hypothetical protein C2E23DRAFT_725907 [Lenzites betulinus]|nr:hypothetical protein C2E23DRAFT_725907 [Lenzites betulinus]